MLQISRADRSILRADAGLRSRLPAVVAATSVAGEAGAGATGRHVDPEDRWEQTVAYEIVAAPGASETSES